MRRPDVPPAEPCQAIDDKNLVVAVNQPATEAGIRVGMRRREAEAICPIVATIEHDPGAEMARFERVAVAVETLIPRIEVVIPGLILAPVTGAVRYFGGEAPLMDRIAKEVDAVAGQGFRIGLAAGPFAARRAAELATDDDPILLVDDDDAFRAGLDVAALDSEDPSLFFSEPRQIRFGVANEMPTAATSATSGVPTQATVHHQLQVGRRADDGKIPADDRIDPGFPRCLDEPEGGVDLVWQY